MEQQDVSTGSPATSTSTTSNRGSPSTLATSPTLSPPPKSPEVYRQSLSPPTTTGDSPLPPLPAEIYLLILKYIPVVEVPYLMLVSRAWKNSIENEPQLWPNLVVNLDLDQKRRNQYLARRSNVNAARFGGGIRDLDVFTYSQQTRNSSHDDKVPGQTIIRRLEHTFRLLHFACVPTNPVEGSKNVRRSTLESVKIRLSPNTMTSLYVLESFLYHSTMPYFNALKHIEIQIRVPLLRLVENFFSIWTHLETMSINSITATNSVRTLYPSWRFDAPVDNLGRIFIASRLLNLKSILWNGTQISRSLNFPEMPVLTTIKLYSVVWEGKGFFLLIRKVRKTLAYLECIDFNFQEDEKDEGWADFDNFINIQDPNLLDEHHFPETKSDMSDADVMAEPAPIILPALKTLILINETTPPLFASLEHYDTTGDSPPFPTPVFHMPNLLVAKFDEVNLEEEDYIPETDSSLAVFGRNAPSVTLLSVTGTGASPHAIFYCLAGMSAKLVNLDLNNSLASDALILRLKGLTPKLEWLDVRRCTDVTIQGVARLVETMRDDYEGTHRMKGVKVDPPEWGDAEYTAYMWLDYVGVLTRPDWDFEGTGPVNLGDQLKFRRLGKRDAEKVEMERLAAVAKQERLAQQQYLQKMQKDFGFIPTIPVISTTSGSSTSPYFTTVPSSTTTPAYTSSSDSPLSTPTSESTEAIATTPATATTTNLERDPTVSPRTAQSIANLVLQQQQQQEMLQYHQQQHLQQQQQQQHQQHQQEHLPPTLDPRIRRASAPSPVEEGNTMDVQERSGEEEGQDGREEPVELEEAIEDETEDEYSDDAEEQNEEVTSTENQN